MPDEIDLYPTSDFPLLTYLFPVPCSLFPVPITSSFTSKLIIIKPLIKK
ncbi:MAG: hypothetical protein F6K26_30145 [Moorea sp. SIO2I5]|nr:hypothetical protein [Moorena sp. SIO2I5]